MKGKQRMVMASQNDWLAVMGDMTAEDEYTMLTLRGAKDRGELIRMLLDMDQRELYPSWAWLDEEDRPLAVAGLSSNAYWPVGVVEAWSIATPALRTRGNGLAYTRTCRRLCEAMLQERLARRLFGYSWVGHPTSARWLAALGFTEEGTMRGLGTDGADFRMFGRVS